MDGRNTAQPFRNAGMMILLQIPTFVLVSHGFEMDFATIHSVHAPIHSVPANRSDELSVVSPLFYQFVFEYSFSTLLLSHRGRSTNSRATITTTTTPHLK